MLRKQIEDWPVDNIKKTGFNWYVYDFGVDYDVGNILYTQKFLMKKIT